MLNSLDDILQAVRLKLPEYLMEKGVSDPYKKFCCLDPKHIDKNPSTTLHKSGIFISCWSCSKNWDIFALAHDLDGYPITGDGFVKDNVLKLADKYGIKYQLMHNNEEKAALRYNYFRAYKIVGDYLEKKTTESANESFEKELKKRNWPKKLSIDYGLGCVDSYKEIQDLLINNGFTKDFIDLCGLMRADIFNSDNVIFKICDERSRVIAFYSRDTKFEDKKEVYKKSLDKMDVVKPKQPMKYNSSANFTGIYEKNLTPYGINDIKDFHKVILVEGHGCKHSLKLKGVDNVIALGGLALGDTTIDKLIGLGATTLVLMLDNDDKGKDRIKSIIQKYYGRKSVDFSVIDMSGFVDVKDPDEFIRKYSIDAFKQLPEKNALEWFAIQELYEKADSYAVIEVISPLIALDRSPINRLKIESIIADMTEINKSVIHAEVEQRISTSKDRKSEMALRVLEEARELVQANPDALGAAINLIETKIGNLNKNSNDDDLYSSGECLKAIANIQDIEENETESNTIITGFEEFDRLISLPPDEAFCLIFGPPNTLKSTLCINKALGILLNNPDAIVIIHTIDDSRTVYINRLVAQLARLKINFIKRPKYYLQTEELNKKRSDAYKVISELIRTERLIIKDIIHGGTVEYHGRLVQHYRDKFPSKNIFAICDNLHRLDTEVGYEDGRTKFKYISGLMKSYTTKYSCIEFNTVEMTKQGMYEKPKNASAIAEAASLQFDANLIVYLWNELNILREDAELFFDAKVMEYDAEAGYYFKDVQNPIIEALVLKNKISEFKGSLFYKAFPELALMEGITSREADEILNNNKKQKNEGKK